MPPETLPIPLVPAVKTAEQFVYTHCRLNESVNRQEGFQIRAASTDDPDLCRCVAELGYTPPRKYVHSSDDAPRRLAWFDFTAGNSGEQRIQYQVLAHTRYLGKEANNRPGNYRTRCLFYPPPADGGAVLTLRDAVRCWDSRLWDEEEFPDVNQSANWQYHGTPPHGTAITDETLAEFLGDDSPSLRGVIPPRFDGIKIEHRQRLLRETIKACLLSLGSGSTDDPDSRMVCIHAEPVVVALLLYGAARLVPEDRLHELTFTTYEAVGQRLSQCRWARVIGTMADDPERGIQDDLPTNAYLIDSFAPDNHGDLPFHEYQRLDKYIALVANRKWDVLSILGKMGQRVEASSLSVRDQAWDVHRELGKATNPNTAADDIPPLLVRVARHPVGATLFDSNIELKDLKIHYDGSLWHLLRQACLSQRDLRKTFAKVLGNPKQLDDYCTYLHHLLWDIDGAGEASNELQQTWNAHWHQLKELLDESRNSQETKQARYLNKVLCSTIYEDRAWLQLRFTTRLSVAHEWHLLCGFDANQALAIRDLPVALLQGASVEDIRELEQAAGNKQMPPYWIGWSLALSARAETAPAIHEMIMGADPQSPDGREMLTAFCDCMNGTSPKHVQEVLELLFRVDSNLFLELLFLLHDHGLIVNAQRVNVGDLIKRLEQFAKDLDATVMKDAGWQHHWHNPQRLELIAPLLTTKQPIANRLWQVALGSFGLDLLRKKEPEIERFKRLVSLARQQGNTRVPDKVLHDIQYWRHHLGQAEVGTDWGRMLMVGVGALVVGALLGVAAGWWCWHGDNSDGERDFRAVGNSDDSEGSNEPSDAR